MDQGLPRSLRLRTRRDFSRVQRSGARVNAGLLQLIVRPTGRGRGRFGLTVSRKVGNAVRRNLLKRRLRELLRKNREGFEALEVVIVARPGAAELTYGELAAQLTEGLKRARELPTRGPKGGPRGKGGPQRGPRGGRGPGPKGSGGGPAKPQP